MKAVIVREETCWPVACLWLTLTGLVAATSTFSLAQPSWWVRGRDAMGPLQHCQGRECARWSTLQLSCLLYGGGGACLCLSAFAGMISLLLRDIKWRHKAISAIGYFQIGAVVLCLSGLLVHPLELGTPSVKKYCGLGSSMYYPDQCQFSWAFMLAIVSAAISIYCPILARFIINSYTELDCYSNLRYM